MLTSLGWRVAKQIQLRYEAKWGPFLITWGGALCRFEILKL